MGSVNGALRNETQLSVLKLLPVVQVREYLGIFKIVFVEGIHNERGVGVIAVGWEGICGEQYIDLVWVIRLIGRDNATGCEIGLIDSTR